MAIGTCGMLTSWLSENPISFDSQRGSSCLPDKSKILVTSGVFNCRRLKMVDYLCRFKLSLQPWHIALNFAINLRCLFGWDIPTCSKTLCFVMFCWCFLYPKRFTKPSAFIFGLQPCVACVYNSRHVKQSRWNGDRTSLAGTCTQIDAQFTTSVANNSAKC